MTARSDYAAAHEVNGLEDPTAYHQVERKMTVDFADKRLARITRLRLIGERGYPRWDVSYCHGDLEDGTPVRVQLPEYSFPKKGLKGALIKMCREHKVYGMKLGIYEAISTLD